MNVSVDEQSGGGVMYELTHRVVRVSLVGAFVCALGFIIRGTVTGQEAVKKSGASPVKAEPATQPGRIATVIQQGPPRVQAMLPFQGRLLTPKGDPVAESEVTVLFSIYGTATGDVAIWSSDPKEKLKVEKGGLVNTILTGGQFEKIDFGAELYLGIRVDDPKNKEVVEQEPEMLPRIRILPALHAQRADKAGDAATVQGRDLVKEFDDMFERRPGKPVDGKATSSLPVPAGTLMQYAGRIDGSHFVPEGWLVCDGSVCIGQEPEFIKLFAAIGTLWGDAEDNDPNTFRLPDLERSSRSTVVEARVAVDGGCGIGPSGDSLHSKPQIQPAIHWIIKK